MAVTNEKILYGSSIETGTYYRSNYTQRLFFRDQNTHRMFAIDEPTVFKNILLLGGAGSGKTNVMNQIVAQVLNWNNSENNSGVSLIFDTKGDYISHNDFCKPSDYIIGNDKRYRDSSVTWNIFEEVLADGNHPVDYEANAREIANVLFKDRGSKTQPFFANAARDIFANMIIYFIRRQRDNAGIWADKLNNQDFISFLLGKTPSQFSQICMALFHILAMARITKHLAFSVNYAACCMTVFKAFFAKNLPAEIRPFRLEKQFATRTDEPFLFYMICR